MSQIRPLPGANVRSPCYFVARMSVSCPHCGLPTRLLALALPHDHETLNEDAQDDDEGSAERPPEAWQRAGVNAFLFCVERLPKGVRDRLNELSRLFRPAHSAATLNTYWTNHCEHCGRVLDDHELHCEPGAFMASSEAAAANIELVRVPEPFAAVAAGYAMEPEFFACMRKS
ncbi:MAG: hypothetical protein WBF89_07730 [Steroidobacteraceae bacterium]